MPSFMPSLNFDIDPSLPQNELTQTYFDTLHRCFPMINEVRFRSMSPFLSTNREIAGLSHAVWLHASSLLPEKYVQWEEHCYQSARHHLEKLETEDAVGTFMPIDALQAVILIALYEFKQMYFARAWMTIGKAMRLAQMFGLHKMDGNPMARQDSGFQPGMHPTRDWTELEERRRTFWVAFNVDWYASSRIPLKDAMRNALVPGLAPYSPFAGAVVMAGFCGRCLRHLQNAHKADVESDYTYDFWANHYSIDGMIVQTLLSSLNHLNIPNGVDSVQGLSDPNTIFLNMNMRATVICLHQAAVVQMEKTSLPATLIAESESRALKAAQEIAHIMKISQNSIHLSKVTTDRSPMTISALTFARKLNMFTTWCLYTAARVLVATLRSSRSSTDVLDSLQTILSALNAFKISNPRTELFINQVNLELGGSNVVPFSNPSSTSDTPNRCNSSGALDSMSNAFTSTPLTTGSRTPNPLMNYEWSGMYNGQE
ncbi:MAG: hypothetical protein Q9166_004886 [cf. Caloplaca sp. 2 TL-2023]